MKDLNWKDIGNVLDRSTAKYPFYDGNYSYNDHSTSQIAQKLPMSRVGWARRAVDMRSNKTHFDKFENDILGLNSILEKYHVIKAFDKVKSDTLVCGVGFLALAGDRVMPFTALEATGTYDWYEQNLSDGVAVFREKSKKGGSSDKTPDSYMRFTQNKTIVFDNSEIVEHNNSTGRPLMTILTHKSTTKQPFGRSVISKTARDAIIDGSRTVRQAMVAGHHYNSKVRAILGVDNESEVNKVEMKSGDVLTVGANQNGQIPQLGEFAQHATAPFDNTILISARNFCADTKLSLSNLAIPTNAPQSAEELEIVGDDLRDDIVEWQAEIGEQLKHFAVTLWMLDNNVTSIDDNLRAKINATSPVWMPVFRPDVSKFGDGLNKLAEKAPAIVKTRSIWRHLGLSSSEIDEVIKSTEENIII